MSLIAPVAGYNDRVVLKEILPLDTPFTLNVFPVNACNFRCNYCAQSLGAKEMKKFNNYDVSEKMSMETFQKIVLDSKKFRQPYKLLSFMGHGEPLLNKDLPKMIKFAKEHNIANRIEILTNGALLTHEYSDALIEAGVTNIRLSLQGLSSEQYKKTSAVNINFEDFINNLAYFHKKSENTDSNLFVKILNCSLNKDEEEKFYKMFNNISSRMYIEEVKPVYDSVKFTKDISDLTTDRYGNKHEKRFVCPLPFFTLSIWPNGDIAPCDAIYKPTTLGNVNTHDLSKVFYNNKVNNFRLKLLNGEKETMFGCNKCCAPDDVSHEKDELDTSAKVLIKKYI